MDKRKKILSGIGGVVLVLVLYFAYQHIMYVTTDNAQIDAHSVMLASKVGGFVVDVKVLEGAKVKAGDILVEIDERDYQNTLTQMQSEMISLEAKKKDAEKNFQRVTSLYKSGAISQQQYDTSSTAVSEVRAKYDAVNAQVAQAQLNLDNTKIKAPSDGFIAKKSVEVGQLASPGVPLIGFVDATERWVTANFKETEIEKIKPGAKANIEVDAIGSKSFTGTVLSLGAATGATFSLLPPDNATGNFTKVVQRIPVKIQIDNINENDIEMLRAGLSADIKVRK
jgi:membrane fusion protein (multidrug efflux system)